MFHPDENRYQRGYALLIVLLVSFLFIGLAGAVGTQVTTNLTATQKRVDSSSARYAAYAGLQHAILALKIDPDWNANLLGVQVLGTESTSYTVEVTNNRSGTSTVQAPDATDVPPGAVYCAAVGIVNESAAISLHAMTGMISERNPELEHAAFADTDLVFDGSAQAASFNPTSSSFSFDATGRAILANDNSNGDVGSNRYLSLEGNSLIDGDVYSSVDTPATLLSSNAPTGSLLDLLDPREVPDFSPPATASNPAPLAPNPVSLSSATSQTTAYQSLIVTPGNTVTVGPGRYYFPDGIRIQGRLDVSTSVDASHPVVFFIGNDAKIGNGARINPGGNTRNFQIYFVDHNDGSDQEYRQSGDSQVFATVVGSTANSNFQDTAELYGGFLGRSVRAQDSARMVYDESLAGSPLAVQSNWGLAGITEPPPSKVLAAYTATRDFVAEVESSTASYARPVDATEPSRITSPQLVAP